MKIRKQHLFLDGPSGRLETVLEVPGEEAPAGIAICCHPHPLYGGTLSNKVTHTLARSFLRLGSASVRFNFRGVGESQGEYADGVGETEDTLAAIRWARGQYPGTPVFLAGFSFGAAVALRAAHGAPVAGLVTVAPAVERVAVPDGIPDCPWLVVQGSADELVSVDSTVEWINGLEPGPELAVLNEADHFFHGKLIELRALVVEFLTRQTELEEGEEDA